MKSVRTWNFTIAFAATWLVGLAWMTDHIHVFEASALAEDAGPRLKIDVVELTGALDDAMNAMDRRRPINERYLSSGILGLFALLTWARLVTDEIGFRMRAKRGSAQQVVP